MVRKRYASRLGKSRRPQRKELRKEHQVQGTWKIHPSTRRFPSIRGACLVHGPVFGTSICHPLENFVAWGSRRPERARPAGPSPWLHERKDREFFSPFSLGPFATAILFVFLPLGSDAATPAAPSEVSLDLDCRVVGNNPAPQTCHQIESVYLQLAVYTFHPRPAGQNKKIKLESTRPGRTSKPESGIYC